jgi:hypothetical protein
MKDLRKFIATTIKEYLNESISNNIIYRGGLPLNKDKVKSDGVSFTKNIEIGKFWAGSVVGGKLYKYKLMDNANILTPNDFPENIVPKERPYNHQDKERIVNHALVEGYDGVDLSTYFNESEIRIFNLDVIE